MSQGSLGLTVIQEFQELDSLGLLDLRVSLKKLEDGGSLVI